VHIRCKTPLNAALKLFGSRGRLITRTRIAGARNSSIKCRHLAPGIYTVAAETAAGAIRQTFSVL
jgi:hypothetical protein